MFFQVVIFLIVSLDFHVEGHVLKLVVDVCVNERGTSLDGGCENSSDSILLENGRVLSAVDIAQEEGSELGLLGKDAADVFDHDFGFWRGFGHEKGRSVEIERI